MTAAAARLGLSFPVPGLGLHEYAPLLRAAADTGYEEFWAGEAQVADAFALLATVAALEPRLAVGTAIVPAFTRAPGLLAVSAATLASLAPGPSLPEQKYLDGKGDAARGAELFRVNCAMCHNVAGAGGALTEGKYAPPLTGVTAKHIYEAMVTGPQNMPVFNDLNIDPQGKADIITYLKYIQNNPSPGGFELGSLGPVAEGLFLWIFGLGAIVALTVWITAKSN